jgi:hypothetical protein
VYAVWRHFNRTLVAWVIRNYQPLQKHKTRAGIFLEKIAENEPRLFAHWHAGMEGLPNGSGMSREVHVPFCERSRGRFPRATHHEGHNTLKNQGYYFDHNYGHGKQYLSANIATLILYSFLIHTLIRLIDQDGLAKTIRREVINLLRHTLFILRVRSWEELYQVNLEVYKSS